MGQLFDCHCGDCAATFRAGWGGGINFEELRCTACGDTVGVPRSSVEDPGQHYPHRAEWLVIQQSIKRKGFERNEFERQVQDFLPPCDSCGGRFEYGAPARCPECRSTRIVKGNRILHYD